jgi:hypothetical protein
VREFGDPEAIEQDMAKDRFGLAASCWRVLRAPALGKCGHRNFARRLIPVRRRAVII